MSMLSSILGGAAGMAMQGPGAMNVADAPQAPYPIPLERSSLSGQLMPNSHPAYDQFPDMSHEDALASYQAAYGNSPPTPQAAPAQQEGRGALSGGGVSGVFDSAASAAGS